jgi:hypothetical protein
MKEVEAKYRKQQEKVQIHLAFYPLKQGFS